MSGLYLAAVTTHVLAAMVWVGGMLFFAIVAPILRGVGDDAVRARLFDSIGRRFRVVGWICVGVLLVSGVVQLRLRGWWGAGFWNGSMLLRTQLGVTLMVKLALVALMVIVQAAHDSWLGPKAGSAEPGSDEARSVRKRAAGLARLNAFVAVLLVYIAVRLGRG